MTGSTQSAPPVAAETDRHRHQRELAVRCRHPSGAGPAIGTADVDSSLVALFRARVAEAPHRLAVAAGGGRLTYGEVSDTASEIAAGLTSSRGAVGVAVGLGEELVPALLGCLMAGRPVVPLDPRYPPERLAWIAAAEELDDVVATRASADVASRLSAGATVHVVGETRGRPSACAPALAPGPDDPAVVVYTSGSTGRPKRVVHTHRTILHEIVRYSHGVGLCDDDRLLLVSSPTFTDSVRTIWGAVLNGARLCPYDLRKGSLEGLAGFLRDAGVTVFRSVPTVFRALARSPAASDALRGLRVVYLAGEPVIAADVATLRACCRDEAVLFNGLGTSEALTFAWYLVGHDTALDGDAVPVGWVLEGCGLRLVGADGVEVPPGQPGEVEVATPSLSPAVGGVSRPDGRRAYRTGDLLVADRDGCLTHLGRTDHQYKVRGHRVHAAEVEAALGSLDGVTEVAVTGFPAPDGGDRLAGYVVAGEPAPSPAELLDRLRSRVPDHLVPAVLRVVGELPRTPSGKVDRRALPAPEATEDELAGGEGRTPLERAVCAIWSDVLDLPGIGRDARFLDLGGDSLVALRIVSRVADRLGVEVDAGRLLAAPTPAAMAAVVEAARARRVDAD